MEPLSIANVEPTVFFIRAADALRQRVRLSLESGAEVADPTMSVRVEGVDESHPLPRLCVGTNEIDVYLPDLRDPGPVTLSLLDEGIQGARA